MKTATFAFAALLLAAPTAFAQTTTVDKPAVSTTADGHFYTHQAGEIRASKLIGSKVTNSANESVGEINDVVLGRGVQQRVAHHDVVERLRIPLEDVAVAFRRRERFH